ncbi:MAG: class I SAM-dependent methyltransferase [Spirochaetales bacterium]|nr:class I SAM-dependent methyltransferase [Spirochaetales bacterium]
MWCSRRNCLDLHKVPENDDDICPLCEAPSVSFAFHKKFEYLKCGNCCSVFLKKDCRLNETDEKKRYLEHNNDIHNEGYRNFVSPLTKHIIGKYTPDSEGLDFGAGTGPVISCILRENGYAIHTYDPFFSPDPDVFNRRYDYIACCEVIEHFYNPGMEFARLRNSLKPGGELICKTDLWHENVDFSKWYYKNDPTHVFFYSEKTFLWIKKYIGFENVHIEGRMIILGK